MQVQPLNKYYDGGMCYVQCILGYSDKNAIEPTKPFLTLNALKCITTIFILMSFTNLYPQYIWLYLKSSFWLLVYKLFIYLHVPNYIYISIYRHLHNFEETIPLPKMIISCIVSRPCINNASTPIFKINFACIKSLRRVIMWNKCKIHRINHLFEIILLFKNMILCFVLFKTMKLSKDDNNSMPHIYNMILLSSFVICGNIFQW